MKFFVTAAFPYPNSPTHIGNARSFLLADVIARHRRGLGYNTLYPMGFHYTGTPILTMAESIAREDKELIDLFVDLYKVPRDMIPKMKDPLELARYFHQVSKESMRRLGLGIDWRREFTTIDPIFQSFIRWQFRRLYEKGYVTRGTYPVGWCPVHNMPVGGHDTKDDKDPEIEEFTLIFFKDDKGRIFPAATLRPETIFAVTNIWVNPNEKYVEALVEDKIWIVSMKGFNKLVYQKDHVKKLREFYGRELENVWTLNPITGEKIVVISADFVDPGFGTGVVMSVPSHSPDDYVAYTEALKREDQKDLLKRSPMPRRIIEISDTDDMPAKWIVERYKIMSSKDRAGLEKATREIYSIEYSRGRMSKDLYKYVDDEKIKTFVVEEIIDKPVSEAREKIKSFMRSIGVADVFYELMNAPIYCRCGNEIVVRLLKDQWFLKYSDPEWKELGIKALDKMYIQPEEMRDYMRNLIKNLREKPCARTRGLGTPLPWDNSWIIESLSDSTIYMSFYTIIHKLRALNIPPEEINDDLWDYILLGREDPKKISLKYNIDLEKIIELRKEFLYWYPLDLRVAGKDLANNHLLFFIMNHVALFSEELWPKAMLIHGWVLREGEKMSKSKKNITPLFVEINERGADAVRLVLALSSEIDQDLDYRTSFAEEAMYHLKKLYDHMKILSEKTVREHPERQDEVIASRISRKLLRANDLLMKLKVREAGIIIVYEVFESIQKIISGESVWKGFLELVYEWIKFLSIFTPHIAEEIWREIFRNRTFVVAEKIDLNKIKSYIKPRKELENEYINMVSEDLREIISLIRKRPEKIIFYVSSSSEYRLLREALNYIQTREGLSDFITRHLRDVPAEMRKIYAERLRKIYEYSLKLSSEVKELISDVEDFDEKDVLERNRDVLKELSETSEIIIYKADDPYAPDIMGKKKTAIPLKPAIYIET